MNQPKLLAVFDTTALHRDWTMAGVRWEHVWSLARRGILDVAIPRVVVMEAARQLIEFVSTSHAKLEQQLAELDTTYQRMAQVGAKMDRLSRLDVLPVLQRDDIASGIISRITDMAGEVLPFPTVTHLDVIQRDLDRRKPFHPSGKGYRDALTWISLLERIVACPPEQQVVLVTNNTTDYLTGKAPAPELLEDLPAGFAGGRFRVVLGLDELLSIPSLAERLEPIYDSADGADRRAVRWLRPGDTDAVEASGADALVASALRLRGATVAGSGQDTGGGLDFDRVRFPDEVRDIRIADVSPAAATARWKVYNALVGDSLLIEAQIVADVVFHGIMDGAYYYRSHHQPTVIRIDDAPGPDDIQVAFQRSVILHFRAAAIRQSGLVTNTDFDRAESSTPPLKLPRTSRSAP
jgi:hypothetical protein